MEIDFVIPWVDGNDSAWQAERAQYQPINETGSNTVNRYRDWGLMKYWFRSIEKFTPWVRKIHFITWGHVPEFLNTEHPKINIVRHEDYMPAEALPTFSSHALEINLHRIEELSEHFVYLNDDTFILRPMSETDFFRDGLPCTMGCESPIELRGEIGIWQHAAVNDLGIVNKHFPKREQAAKFRKKYINNQYSVKTNLKTLFLEYFCPDSFTGFWNLHAPAAYCKKTFEEVWNAEPELMRQTTNHRFRAGADVNQWVMLWWQVASGNFSPAVTDSKSYLAHECDIKEIISDITNQTRNMICINDPEFDVDFEGISKQIQDAFEAILPEKCTFEK